MPGYLLIYLLVTGILAGMAIEVPALVIFGCFLGIMPGLLLAFAPTAFIWGVAYAFAWGALRLVLPEPAVTILAFPLAAAAMWGIPRPSIAAAKDALLRYRLDPVEPAAPIRLEGHIRVNFVHGSSNCDNRCLAFLFEPGVDSVTMSVSRDVEFADLRDGTNSLGQHAHTYRLVARDEAGERDVVSKLSEPRGVFGKSLEDSRAMGIEWASRLASDLCVVKEPPLEHYDMLLRAATWQSERAKGADRWRVPSGEIQIGMSEIRTGTGDLLFRFVEPVATALAAPLAIAATGGLDNFRFGWARRTFPGRWSQSWETPIHELDRVLDVRRAAGDTSAARAIIRTALTAALDNPALAANAPEFKIISQFMAATAAAAALPEDFELIERFIASNRFNDLPGAGYLPRIYSSAGMARLCPLIVGKLAGLPENAPTKSGALGQVLARMPEGTFARPDAVALDLLQDCHRRLRAAGLVRRIADMGDRGAPLLLDIVEHHAFALAAIYNDPRNRSPNAQHAWREAHKNVLDSAVSALCVLGPDACDELPRLLRLEAETPPRPFDRCDWDRMMVRVGKPVADVAKPANMSGTEASYRRNLAHWLERFDPRKL